MLRPLPVPVLIATTFFAAAPFADAQWVAGHDLTFARAEIQPRISYVESGYGFAPKWAAGPAWYRFDEKDEPTENIFTVNVNRLVWRENTPDWQANLFAGAGAGAAITQGLGESGAAAGLLQADWENRRFMVAYQTQLLVTGERFHPVQMFHAGWAPWVAEYDEFAPWVYLSAMYDPETMKNVSVTPMIGGMYRNLILAGGVTLKGDPAIYLRYLFSF